MKRLTTLVIAGFIATASLAQDTPSEGDDPLFAAADMADLSEFRWKKRPVLVFADSEDDPAFIEQMELLAAREDELRERDVIVLTDTDPDARAPLRLQMRPRGFMLVLVGKDGGNKLRKPFPWDVREITRSIDKMPMRQREIREEKEAARTR
ncbi:DUF4174 domain-containing protein [Sulfitobacter geojensis]|jgi:hypothetical protein|uniref:DUF4174 domain-containing protein n=1 Tax=Sulfitobacter geojensis TaxID=1342299 RepID=A0AAE2VUL3_9RHOB|nr:DUF4174 domain-containing protein [Sulfitobacter geojensis]MBM1687653.1 DUF4174 domain-containing protein [Sulfitobacter geojensis]MBM1691720.1 DUF4174 domain-containing protein [Sulfitobacter geojensis]MBM1703886.1 DUF4174 domain-containing protein [Sulfitobacter geojensis]MBM1707944.1 DUF4174 domain-containing protein [Sulfitobacter geojensis]MBM1712009.1 DUF4174 domain-containing protein [Sulfitobacter geojensis]